MKHPRQKCLGVFGYCGGKPKNNNTCDRCSPQQAERMPCLLSEVNQQFVTPLLGYDCGAVEVVNVLYAACSLTGTDAVCIVLEGQSSRAADDGKLSAVLPREGVAQSVVVGERIADGIVGNGCAVVLGQLIVSVNQ